MSVFSDKRFNEGQGVAALYILPGGRIEGQVSSASRQWESVMSTVELETGQWYEIELVCDLEEIRLYTGDKVIGRTTFSRERPASERTRSSALKRRCPRRSLGILLLHHD